MSATDIQQAVDRVYCFDVAVEPTGIYVGRFGPALCAIIGYRGEVVWGPDSPMADKLLDVLFGDLEVGTPAEFAAALDALAAAVCPPPTLETAAEYIYQLKENFAMVQDLFEPL